MMKYVSYYCAVIVRHQKWYVYIPDFNSLLELKHEDDAYSVSREYIYSMMIQEAERHTPFSIKNMPVPSPLWSIMVATKRYLRRLEISLDHYIDNIEVVVGFSEREIERQALELSTSNNQKVTTENGSDRSN